MMICGLEKNFCVSCTYRKTSLQIMISHTFDNKTNHKNTLMKGGSDLGLRWYLMLFYSSYFAWITRLFLYYQMLASIIILNLFFACLMFIEFCYSFCIFIFYFFLQVGPLLFKVPNVLS